MNAMELSARLSLDASNFHKGMQNAESGFKSFGNRLKSIGGAMVKTVVAGAAAATAAFVAVGKRSIDAYANYEQLTGGIETLFKTSAKTMMKYADQAYKTSGVSANKYMEMSTSFAASLISGLGGDTAKAADMANMAIVDMSDNANKMGTDLTMIQNAYQGFAKQNYTMLDNLKLGYGGTKTEMERLLADAGKLTGKKFNVSNFADIVQAIHAIQTQMDITGTTSKEASTTISGSMNMVKAAWEDMLVEMSKPQEASKGFRFMQDESEATAKSITKGPQAATQKFIASVKTMLGNVLPAVRNFISNFGDVVAAIAPMIGEELPQLLADFLPKFFEAGKNLVVGIGRGITKAFQTFKWPTWKEVQAGAQKAWQGIQKGVETLGGLVFGTDKEGKVNWPTWDTVRSAATNAWNAIKAGALEFAGLVFGKKEDGTVDWPTWEDVSATATAAWNTIKANALEFAGLVFGKKEDGTVDWPTWEDVSSAASGAWETIKSNALNFAGLVFGKKEDGTVDWPTWDDVSSAATSAWEAIKANALAFGGLVFGKKADGTVDWPDWSDVQGAANSAWETIKSGALGLGGLVFGKKSDGTVDWPDWSDVQEAANSAWETIKSGALGLAGLVFGNKSNGTVDWPTWSDVSAAAEAAWQEICGQAAALTGFVFGDTDKASSVFDNIKESWTTLKDTIQQGAINIATYFFDNADPATVSSAISGIGTALETIGVAIGTYLTVSNLRHLSQAVSRIKDLFSIGVGKAGNFLTENKVALILSGIAAAAMLIYEHWGQIEPVLAQIGEWFTTNIVIPVQQAIDAIKEFFGLTTGSGATLNESQMANVMKSLKEWQETPFDISDQGAKRAEKFTQFADTLKNEMQKAGFTAKEIAETIEKLNTPEGLANVDGLIAGLAGASESAQQATDAVNALKEAADAAAGTRTINYEITTTGTIPNTLYAPAGGGIAPTRPRGIKKAKGDWNIPYDNYPAILHRDEMVLTASQARQYREGQNSGIDAATLASAMRSAVLDLTMEFNGREVGRMFGDSTTARVNRNIGQINRRRRYGYGG